MVWPSARCTQLGVLGGRPQCRADHPWATDVVKAESEATEAERQAAAEAPEKPEKPQAKPPAKPPATPPAKPTAKPQVCGSRRLLPKTV
mmetsp:Transcript_8960/g.27303  ORF Transcript_8960/g.27303 Transcript_8960/m.27303 type:complete len:89 (-) Transcript_8960:27-293(-)